VTGRELDADLSASGRAGPRSSAWAVWTPVLWTLAVGMAWVTVAVWRPTTTWHLAPALLGAAAPWVVAQDLRAGDLRAIPRVAAAAVTGLVVSVLVTWVLAAAGLLRGPPLPGFVDARTEALVLAGAGAVLAALVGVRRTMRTPTATRSAWVGQHLLARSDDGMPRPAPLFGSGVRPAATACRYRPAVARSAAGRPSMGSRTVKVVPTPTVVSTVSVPP
jgi:hypothetical protein